MRLQGKIALVTGASRGMGKAAAVALAAEGAQVVVAARTEEASDKIPGTIHQTVEEIAARGGQAFAVRADLSSTEDIDSLVQKTVDHFGGIDIVLHNAAAAARGRLVDTPMRRWDILFNVNARATAALISAAYPIMKERGGGHAMFVTQPPAQVTGDGATGFSPSYRLSKNVGAQIVAIASEEAMADNIGVCGVWPGGGRDTVGGRMARGWDAPRGLNASVFGDAIVEIAARPPRYNSGRFTTDEDVLRDAGVTDFAKYEPTTERPEF